MILTDMLGYFGLYVQRVRPFEENDYAGLPGWMFYPSRVNDHLRASRRILDIGCGQFPHPLATTIMDLEDYDRADFRWSYGNVQDIPAPTGYYDYVIASHVLEHVEDPVAAGKELSRVAKSGYIEVPRYGKDIIVGPGAMHRWQVVEHQGELMFFPYGEGGCPYDKPSPAQRLWMDKRYHPWQDYMVGHWADFNIQYEWGCYGQHRSVVVVTCGGAGRALSCDRVHPQARGVRDSRLLPQVDRKDTAKGRRASDHRRTD